MRARGPTVLRRRRRTVKGHLRRRRSGERATGSGPHPTVIERPTIGAATGLLLGFLAAAGAHAADLNSRSRGRDDGAAGYALDAPFTSQVQRQPYPDAAAANPFLPPMLDMSSP